MQETINQTAIQLTDQFSPQQNHREDKKQKTLNQLLKTYIDYECKLTNLVTQMHSSRFDDPITSKDYSQKAHALKTKINSLANEITQHPDFKHKTANETLFQEQVMSIAQVGGFARIKERLLNQELTTQDLTALTKHLHLKTQKTNQHLQQNRDRGERYY